MVCIDLINGKALRDGYVVVAMTQDRQARSHSMESVAGADLDKRVTQLAGLRDGHPRSQSDFKIGLSGSSRVQRVRSIESCVRSEVEWHRSPVVEGLKQCVPMPCMPYTFSYTVT